MLQLHALPHIWAHNTLKCVAGMSLLYSLFSCPLSSLPRSHSTGVKLLLDKSALVTATAPDMQGLAAALLAVRQLLPPGSPCCAYLASDYVAPQQIALLEPLQQAGLLEELPASAQAPEVSPDQAGWSEAPMIVKRAWQVRLFGVRGSRHGVLGVLKGG